MNVHGLAPRNPYATGTDARLIPHALSEVIDENLSSNFKFVDSKDGFEFESPDLCYLGERSGVQFQNLYYAVFEYDERIVTEALRRVPHPSVPLLFFLCKEVRDEETQE